MWTTRAMSVTLAVAVLCAIPSGVAMGQRRGWIGLLQRRRAMRRNMVSPWTYRSRTWTSPARQPYYSSPAVDQAIRNQRMLAEQQQRMQTLRQHDLSSPFSPMSRYNPSSPNYRGPGSFFSPMNRDNPSSPNYIGPGSLFSPMNRYNPSSPNYRGPGSFSSPMRQYNPAPTYHAPSFNPPTPSLSPSFGSHF